MARLFVPLAIAAGMLMPDVLAQSFIPGPITGNGFSDVLHKVPVGPVGAAFQPGTIPCPFQSVAFEADVFFFGVPNANNWIVDYGPGWDRGFSVGSDGQYLRCSVYDFTIKAETPESMIWKNALSKVGLYWDGQTLTCLLNGVVTGTVSTLPAGPIPCNIQNEFIRSPTPPQAELWIGGEGCQKGSDYCTDGGRWFWNGLMDNITLNGVTIMSSHTTTLYPTTTLSTTTFNWNLTTSPSFPDTPVVAVVTTTNATATTTTAESTTIAPNTTLPATPAPPVTTLALNTTIAPVATTAPATTLAPVTLAPVTLNTTNASRLYEEDTLADASGVGPSRMSAFAVVAGVSSLFVAFAMVAMRFVRPRRNIYEETAQLIEADDELPLRGAPVHQEAVE